MVRSCVFDHGNILLFPVCISSFGVKRLWLTHASIRVPSTGKYLPDKNVRSNCSGGIDERPVVDYSMQKSRGRCAPHLTPARI